MKEEKKEDSSVYIKFPILKKIIIFLGINAEKRRRIENFFNKMSIQ